MKTTSRPRVWTRTLASIFLVLGALLLVVRPGNAQNAGVSFDFNTPGQFLNTPYNLTYNDWLVGAQVFSGALPSRWFEVASGGVGNSGAIDLLAGGTENAAVVQTHTFDFSAEGTSLTAVSMVKIKAPTRNARSTQMGFVTERNLGTYDDNPQAFMTVILQSTAQPALTYNLRTQRRNTNGGISETTLESTPGSVTLTDGNWYKLSATFVNQKAGGGYTLNTFLQDMGPDGTTPGDVVISFSEATVFSTVSILDATAVRLAIRGLEDTGVDLRDNIYAYTTPGPVTVVAPTPNQTVSQGSRAIFTALVDGEGPYAYQWEESADGETFTEIAGETAWRYIAPQATLSDSGKQFRAVVAGPSNTVTTGPGTLTVTPLELAVVSAGSVGGDLIGVLFNQPVDKATAENPANYLVNGTPAFAAARREQGRPENLSDGHTVLVTPSSVVSGTFTVTINDVEDLSGGAIGAVNSAEGTVIELASLDINNAAPAGSTYSFGPDSLEITGGGADIWGLSDQFRFAYTQTTGDFDVQMNVAHVDIVRGPTKAGFNVRASLEPSSAQVLAAVNPEWPARRRHEGTVRHTYGGLTVAWGGTSTRTELNPWIRLRREGDTFTRYASPDGVTWTADGQVTHLNMPETVFFGLAMCSVANGTPGTALFDNYGAFAGYPGAEIEITEQPPASVIIAAGSAASLSLTATVNGAPAGELQYIWQRNDGGGWNNLPGSGGTSASSSTGTLDLSDDGAQFRAVLKVPGIEEVISEVTTITVTDEAPPTLFYASAPHSLNQVVLVFSEPVSASTATAVENYSVTSGETTIEILSAQFLGGDPRTVVLTTATPLVPGEYEVVINDVEDLGGNAIAPDTSRTFFPPPQGTGPVVIEVYQDIGGGGAPDTLVNHALFTAGTPTFIVYSNVFGFNVSMSGTGSHDNYGVRAYTYFVPPSTGVYKFWIRNDDGIRFFMNTSGPDPDGKEQLYTVDSAQGIAVRAQNINLTGGQPYYMEVLLKEGGGGDGFFIVARDQDDPTTPGTEPIPASMLAYPRLAAPRTPVVSELYLGHGGSDLNALNNAVNSAAFQAGTPDVFAYQKSFYFQTTLGNTRYDNYLGRIYSYFVAPSTGVFKFWMRSDDASQLYMNTSAENSTDPAGMVLLGQLGSFTGDHTLVAQNVSLTAGQRYYIEARWKEGGGGDGIVIAMRPQDDDSTPPNTEFISGDLFELPTDLPSVADRLGPVAIAAVAPIDPAVTDGQRVTFTATGLTGSTAGLNYYWTKDGVIVPSSVGSLTYTTDPLRASDDGSVISFVVENYFSQVVESSVITVTSDEDAPTLVSAVGSQLQNTVVVSFDEDVDATTASFAPNYQISGGVSVLSVAFDNVTSRRVTLHTTPQTPGTVYTVTVNGVSDVSSAGNTIEADSTIDFTAWDAGGRGLLVELFTGISGTAVPNLTSTAKYQNNLADVSGHVNRFFYDSRSMSLDGFGPFAGNGLDNYGARISGLFIAPSNGLYRFYISSDDLSELYLNPDGSDPAGKILIAQMNLGCCQGYESTSAGLNNSALLVGNLELTGGEAYYIEALFKEGGGGDYFRMAFREAGDPGVPPNSEHASGDFFRAFGNPDAVELTVTENPPAELTVVQNDSYELSGAASVTPAGLAPYLTYQWQRNEVDIPGANSPNLSAVASLSDDGALVRLQISAPGGVVAHTTATELTVTPDTTPPFIVSVNSLDGNSIGVLFSELVTKDSATDLVNWEINGNAIVSEVIMRPDPGADSTREALLVLSEPVTTPYTVTANGLQDLADNEADSTVEGIVQGLIALDIGGPAGAGSSFSHTVNEIDVVAGGADIWGSSDQGHFTLTQRSGDFDVHVQLADLTRAAGDGDGITKAGIMVRESLDANARKVTYLAEPPASIGGRDIYEASQRLGTGGGTIAWAGGNGNVGGPAGVPNTWIRIKREGNFFTAYRSSDGVDWMVTTTTALEFGNTVWVGLGTTAHIPSPSAATVKAEYRNLYLPNPPAILVQPSPAAQTVDLHAEVSYTVEASNPPDSGELVYRWRRNGVIVAGQNSATLTLAAASAADSGVYTVEVGNDGGMVTSDAVTLTVVNQLPVVTAQELSTDANEPVSVSAETLLADATDPEGDPLTLIAVSGVAPATFSADFNDGAPTGATLFGSATVEADGGVGGSGSLRLTPAATSQSGSFVLDELTPGKRVSAFTASFTLRISNGSGEPADGFSFNFARDLPLAATGPRTAENGMGSGFSFAVRNYRFGPYPGGGTANTSGMRLRYGGQDVAGVQIPVWNSPRHVPVWINVTADGFATVKVDGTNVFDNLPLPGYTPSIGRFGAYARTGGQFEEHVMDDLTASVLTIDTAAGGMDGDLFGTAYIAGGVLRLTDAANNQQGSFVSEVINTEPATEISASFMVRLGGGTARPADGLSFSLAADLPMEPFGEEGAGSYLIVSLDAWDNGGADTAPAIEVKYGGADAANVVAFRSLAGIRDGDPQRDPAGPILTDGEGQPVALSTGGAFAPVSLSVTAEGILNLSYKGVVVFENLEIPGFVPASNLRAGFGARTGGANDNHWVDDVVINITTASGVASFSSDFNSLGFGTVVLSDGVVTYTPPPGYVGVDTFYYIVSDGQVGGTSAGEVTVTVGGIVVNPPVISECAEDQVLVAENGTIELPDLRAGVQVTPESGEVTIVQSPAPGSILEGGDTVVTFTVSNAGGEDTCTATVRVLVPVSFMNVGILEGQIVAQIQTVAGLTYRIQVTDELKPDGETEWTTIALITGDGSLMPLAAPIAAEGNAFFRIVVE